ncbi:MAG: Cys-tRNA(Pro) deacylase [Gemmatimonadetes bacterium]|nr:Cys-tRNA(Pro) deacylase [Gemmatimonadota bacterium]|tara:strand:+ start:741 stop:1223 length:483 start_codon:yes stop_codon:yes gene_type:complete
MAKPPPKTNAARILDQSGIPYDLRTYPLDESDLSAVKAAAELGIPTEQVYKTLVAQVDTGEIVLACIPADAELDFKSLANLAGGKRVELAPLADLQKLTGYVRGGCSPLGTKRPLRLFIDEYCEVHDTISISAGLRGVQILINPTELIRVTEAMPAAIAR